MKRSKKPLTFAAVVAAVGALSLGVEGCVYGPPQETNVYGPPPDDIITVETVDDAHVSKPENTSGDNDEVCVYGPAPDVDNVETDVYGPPPDDVDNIENDVYGPPPDDN